MLRRHPATYLAIVCLALLPVIGCTEFVESADTDVTGPLDIPVVDIRIDAHELDVREDIRPDGVFYDEGSDSTGDALQDAITDVEPEIQEGEPGWPCTKSSDCNSEFCLDTPDGRECSQLCGGSSCPRGYSCLVFAVAGDAVSVCVHTMPKLCMPCHTDDDCKSAQTDDFAACVGDNAGRFCAGQCADDEDCPRGYVCTDTLSAAGSATRQCLPVDGACECSARAIEEGATTECVFENGLGRCVGVIACTEDGLQPCTVGEPTVETCNSMDDDCDGTTDNVAVHACLVKNNFGSCPGTSTCVDGVEGCEGPQAAQEACNGIDDNCNGTKDEENATGCSSYYEDLDGDTWGNAARVKCLCAGAGKYTATRGGDCDESTADVKPGATESCNGIDDNCNGSTDEENASGCRNYYYDGDSDTWGTTATPKCLCVSARPYSALRTGDCNDSNGNVNPGMAETCNGVDDNCDGQTDPNDSSGCENFYYDFDSDDYGSSSVAPRCQCGPNYLTKYKVQVGGDCNDLVVTISPAATEKCDGIDNNCNGTTDERGALGCISRWADNDLDGYGAGTAVCTCAEEAPYTAETSGDCDDADYFKNPGVDEACGDSLDNNCNGKTDEENADGCNPWFYDGDRDGFGDATKSRCLCAASAGTRYDSAVGTDCNDTAIGISPGATETCGNNIDDDCDGKTDEEGAKDCQNWYYDSDGDGFGLSAVHKCLCGSDGLYRALVPGDCDDNAIQSYPGGTETCSAGDEDCDGSFNEDNAQGCTKYYYDGDADDYGSDLVATRCICEASPSTGYRALVGGDCNDADSSINPGQTEVCEPDGTTSVDNNCNSFLNEENAIGCKSYYYDYDKDGHGLQYSTPKCYCTGGNVGLRYTSLLADDCNDNDSSIATGLPEWCDGKDNDCDGTKDENGASDCTTYYYDGDRDGYGVTANSECRCAADSGRYYDTTVPNDCNDSNPAIYPGQSVCGVDGSCDGTTLDPLEECDDGNTTNWDGCTNCKVSETRVNSQTSGDQSWPSAVYKADGGLAVVYSSVRTSTEEDIAIRVLTPAGVPSGTETFINSFTAGTQTYPDLAALSTGLVAVWQSDAQDGSGYGITGRILNADGTAKYSEYLVNGTTGNAQTRPAVAVASGDQIVTVWQSYLQDGSADGVYGRIHASPGSAVTAEVLIPQTTTGSQTNPDVATYPAGGKVVVSWTGQYQVNVSTTDTRIFVRVFDETLTALTGEIQVTGSGTNIVGQDNSAIASLGAAGFVVAFEDAAVDGSDKGIRYRAFDWNGNPLAAPAMANTTTNGMQASPAVTVLDSTNFIIAWWSLYGDTDGSTACVARHFVRGGINGNETVLNMAAENYQWYPTLVTIGTTSWYAAWMSGQQDGSGSGIFGRIFGF